MTLKVYGVDTVIVFTRIFGAHFFIPSLFCTFSFLYFPGNFGFWARFLPSLLLKMLGGLTGVMITIPEKKYNNFHFLAEDE